MAGGGAGGIGDRIGGVGAVEIGAPFPDVAEHVVEAPVVWLQRAGVVVLVDAVFSMPGNGIEIPVARGGSSGPACVFPLGFRGKLPFPALREDALVLVLRSEEFAEGVGVVPSNLLDWLVRASVGGGVAARDAFVE